MLIVDIIPGTGTQHDSTAAGRVMMTGLSSSVWALAAVTAPSSGLGVESWAQHFSDDGAGTLGPAGEQGEMLPALYGAHIPFLQWSSL